METSKRRIKLAAATLGAVIASALLTTAPAAAAPGDRDSDGLPDTWETRGVDSNGDGRIDLDLPAMGADPDRKDVFVEMDYMQGLLPQASELREMKQILADLPTSNPDGSTGITLHLDGGPAAGGEFDLGGGNEVPYQSVLPNGVRDVTRMRQTYSSRARDNVFHYMIWADSYGSSGSSGQANLGGLDFLVTLGPRYWKATRENRVGTFVHELGHNLGLQHGGIDDGQNWKPNYLSVMNYSYQLTGVPRSDGGKYHGFSTNRYADLNESALDERSGAGGNATGYDLYWYIGDTRYRAPANGPVDFNQDGTIGSNTAADINRDQSYNTLVAPNDLGLLTLDVGRKGNSNRGATEMKRAEISTDELTAEIAKRFIFNQEG